MISETHTRKVICDLCNCEIEESQFGSGPIPDFFGTRFYVKRGVFGKMVHADLCDDCIRRIREKARKDNNNG